MLDLFLQKITVQITHKLTYLPTLLESWSNLWAALFFVMLFTLGLDSQFTTLETLSTGLEDLYPLLRKKKPFVLFIQCIVMFGIGVITTCTRAGKEWINLFDSYTGSWGLLFSTLLEMVVVGSIYGGGLYAWIRGKEERLVNDIEMMIGKKSKLFWLYWKLCWYLITPLILIVLTVWSLIRFEPLAGHPFWVSYNFEKDGNNNKFFRLFRLQVLGS